MLRTLDGEIRVLDHESDLLLGIDPDAERVERSTELAPGSTLVLFTDGLVERRDCSIDTGVERVMEAVRRARPAHGLTPGSAPLVRPDPPEVVPSRRVGSASARDRRREERSPR